MNLYDWHSSKEKRRILNKRPDCSPANHLHSRHGKGGSTVILRFRQQTATQKITTTTCLYGILAEKMPRVKTIKHVQYNRP